MGVDRIDYLMIGWKLNAKITEVKDFNWDIAYYDLPDNFIYDGMCGKYAVFGDVIAHSDIYDGFDFTYVKEPKMSDDRIAMLKQSFTKMTGEQLENWIQWDDGSIDASPRLMLFTHYN
jgi:hypothetical protein